MGPLFLTASNCGVHNSVNGPLSPTRPASSSFLGMFVANEISSSCPVRSIEKPPLSNSGEKGKWYKPYKGSFATTYFVEVLMLFAFLLVLSYLCLTVLCIPYFYACLTYHKSEDSQPSPVSIDIA
ncbi:hypothetical protein GQ43DRAFT_9897 [Delitschia confertaspora ATCC 74209]|uniref:Uncharacterized protein n=1 Tax=Delitschia confertaspora ATCC 74209 TaxID=1513339 RepID=A0A9P4MQR3_9PLEO|nr:hypothetical protein GQ43DRAFT_9897 [Delitschia confertaspora ATCC 74209]